MDKVEKVSALTTWLDRVIVVWLFVFAAFAPHSIAVTQASWLLGLLFWVVRFFFYPRPKTYRTPVDYALLGFFILTGLSAVLSYEPMVSIGKLRAASLFTIVYLFAENIPSRKILRALALTLIASCMVNVLFTAATRVIGRGVKVMGVTAESPLSAATMTSQKKTQLPFAIVSGDTVLAIDGQKVRSAEQIVELLRDSPSSFAIVTFYRGDQYPPVQVPTGRLLKGTTAAEQLGISSWTIGRDWRATGFFGHYTTYAEALQLIGSLALGLFICVPVKKSRSGTLLLLAVSGIVFALLLTVTRASWIAFLISATLMFLLGTSRRMILIAGACAAAAKAACGFDRSDGCFYYLARNCLARRISFADQQTETPRCWRWHGLSQEALASMGPVRRRPHSLGSYALQPTANRPRTWNTNLPGLVGPTRHLCAHPGPDFSKAEQRTAG
jgi:hypothetical protein